MPVTFNFGEFAASRTITGDTLREIGEANKNVYVLTADLMRTNSIKGCMESFPDRFLNVGVAEQNMMGIAAGLALEGNIPFVTTMATFASMRACEQLRTDICYQNLNVRIVANNSGLTSTGGSTHNAMEDIGILRSMANLTVIVPGDPGITKKILWATMDHEGPVYIRLARGKGEPVVYKEDVDYKIGKALTPREGTDGTIIACGVMVAQAIDAANIIEKEDGKKLRVVDMHTIKPIDEQAVIDAAKQTGRILTLEDHFALSGLGSAVADVIADHSLGVPFKRMGIPQCYPGFGDGDPLYSMYGYGLKDTVENLRALLKK